MRPSGEIRTKLREFIRANYLGAAASPDFTDNASFLKQGIIDSIGILELAQFVQQTFRFKVDPTEILPENFDTVECLERYVCAKLDPKKPS